MATLSETDPWYAALENKLQRLPGMGSSHAFKESNALRKLLEPDAINTVLQTIQPGFRMPDTMVNGVTLPTVLDDFVSYSIMSRLMTLVRSTGQELDLDDSVFGGFCFAPTGAVMACALPVSLTGQASRVFVVFESGLFPFVDGVLRTLIAALPHDFLAGATHAEFMAAWRRTLGCENRSQCGQALLRWIEYLQAPHSHEGLTYVPTAEFGPNGARLAHDMVLGAELFIAAHEYAHAVKSHHKESGQSDHEIELVADLLGARIAVRALERTGANYRFALVGIRIFLRCIGMLSGSAHSHPDDDLRFRAVSVAFSEAGCFDELDQALNSAFLQCFDELVAPKEPSEGSSAHQCG